MRRTCRYRAPARYDDEILIETRPALLRGSVLNLLIAFSAKPRIRTQRKLLAEGETVHVVCDAESEEDAPSGAICGGLRALMARRKAKRAFSIEHDCDRKAVVASGADSGDSRGAEARVGRPSSPSCGGHPERRGRDGPESMTLPSRTTLSAMITVPGCDSFNDHSR